MHHLLPHSDSCLYWCLAYIREGTSDLRIYVAVTSPNPPGPGRYNIITNLHEEKRSLPPMHLSREREREKLVLRSSFANYLTLLFSLRKTSCCPRTRSRSAKASNSIPKRLSEKPSVMILSWIAITVLLALVMFNAISLRPYNSIFSKPSSEALTSEVGTTYYC